MSNNTDSSVSLNALAKILGRSKSGLHYLEKAGHIRRNSLGKFDIAEVQRAIAETVDQTMSHRRKVPVRTGDVRTALGSCSNSDDDREVLVDDEWIPIEQAKAMRDRYLRLLAELNERKEAARKADKPFLQEQGD
ncbi:hypothetical protein ACFQZO_24390 [Bradyrhizobium sp. GCM10027634]|uniref:hypothetical protein n=1 Tax=unclassified Bradyrhizobium TaxID=2631580 RepID=UPI00263A6DD7|nr:hypothetical protein [Bradyrhizobium sp. WYCCWR 12677]MDN5003981.1 hypothetical protein [Bradyrhizobium sp. WYCCWR 12677]